MLFNVFFSINWAKNFWNLFIIILNNNNKKKHRHVLYRLEIDVFSKGGSS